MKIHVEMRYKKGERYMAKSSIDFIREQINEEIKNTCFPQFNRLAKLEAK